MERMALESGRTGMILAATFSIQCLDGMDKSQAKPCRDEDSSSCKEAKKARRQKQ